MLALTVKYENYFIAKGSWETGNLGVFLMVRLG